MTLGEMCALVMTGTGRPDLIADTQLAVRRATLWYHGYENWFRDLREKQFNFAETGYQFQINIANQLNRFKQIRYIRYYDPLAGMVGDYVKPCEPDNLFDEFRAQKTDIYYVAGSVLNIKSGSPQSALIIGWYEMPDIINYQSWIADLYPFAIVDHAIGTVKYQVGEVEEANKFLDPVKGLVATLHIPTLRAMGIYSGA